MIGFEGLSSGRVIAGDAFRQVRALVPTLALLSGLMVVAGLILVAVHYSSDENVTMLVKDPREFTNLSFRTGIFSNVGILVLWSVTVISFSFGLFTRRSHRTREVSGMLITFALLHGFLAIDDLLLIHEEIGLLASRAIGTGEIIEMRSRLEGIVFVAYGILWLAWAWRYRRVIVSTDWILLALAIGGFVGSVAVDMSNYLFPELIPWTPWMPTTLDLADEIFKLGAYLALAAWAWRTASDIWERALGNAGMTPARPVQDAFR